MARVRLDTLLAERGLFESRTRAAASVMAGEVRLGSGGQRAQKPGQLVDPDVVLAVDDAPRFVSRGGIKLANALHRFAIDVEGRRCLDVGASTGGFTDCLLQGGAAHVTTLDVAYGELDWRLRNDERVTVIERTNARSIAPAALPYAPDLVVVDVSFISLTKVLPAVLACCAPSHDVLAMVKPQFEAGRGLVGKGGVVRDPAQRRAALVAWRLRARAGRGGAGVRLVGTAGPQGQSGELRLARRGGREGDVGDVEPRPPSSRDARVRASPSNERRVLAMSGGAPSPCQPRAPAAGRGDDAAPAGRRPRVRRRAALRPGRDGRSTA